MAEPSDLTVEIVLVGLATGRGKLGESVCVTEQRSRVRHVGIVSKLIFQDSLQVSIN